MAQVGKPRGVVNSRAGAAMFRLALHPPAPDLAFFVEHYWVVTWDLRGRAPYLAETLPHPCVHLVIEERRAGHALADRHIDFYLAAVVRGPRAAGLTTGTAGMAAPETTNDTGNDKRQRRVTWGASA